MEKSDKKSAAKTNAQRTEETRAALITSARKLFVEKGFAETGTPEIVKDAQVTRGALYHHFKDKTDLFRAVFTEEIRAIGNEIMRDSESFDSALAGLKAGTRGYFRAVAVPGRARLMLLDGPAVLSQSEMREIESEHGVADLQGGLDFALKSGAMDSVPTQALADLLSAAFDRAALATLRTEDPEPYIEAMDFLLSSLVRDVPITQTE